MGKMVQYIIMCLDVAILLYNNFDLLTLSQMEYKIEHSGWGGGRRGFYYTSY